VSAALEVRIAAPHRREVETAIKSIDRVHRDGQLEALPIIGQTGGTSFGVYQFDRRGVPRQIGVRAADDHWPGLTAAHEIGHFLDHQVLGRRGQFASVSHPDLEQFRQAVHASRAVAEIQKLGRRQRAYFMEGYELWARAYAQYIAKKSGDPLLLAQLDKVRSGKQPWRQWSDEDFAPIEAAIDELMRKKGWI
jgi:hypothetical protein